MLRITNMGTGFNFRLTNMRERPIFYIDFAIISQ